MKKIICDDKRLIRMIRRGTRFVCFGAGNLLRNLCERTGLADSIEWITDNNDTLWGHFFHVGECSIPVIPPEQASVSGQTVLITTTYYEQVYEQVSNAENWANVKRLYYFPSEADRRYLRFAWLWKRLKPQKKIIFRSGSAGCFVKGYEFSDNAKALYDYMLQLGYNKSYKLIWCVYDPALYPELNSTQNAGAISYQWEKSRNIFNNLRYFYHLCTAQYIFFTESHFWLRHCNAKQVRVNLWHGCGFKDRKTKNGPCEKSYEYMTVVSPLYADIHAKEFGCSREHMLVTGLAKEDLLFQPPELSLADILHIIPAKKYLFWLPTFRMAVEGLEKLNEYELNSETGLPIVTSVEKAQQLNRLLEANDLFMVIKLHPVQRNSLIAHLNLSRIRVLENKEIAALGIQINTLLSKADALISDYSSVAVDYLLLNRPMAFALEDVEQYEASRGFVFENIHDFLPGEELYTFEDMERFVLEIANGEDPEKEKRERLRQLMHTYHDGNSCQRILEAVGLEK